MCRLYCYYIGENCQKDKHVRNTSYTSRFETFKIIHMLNKNKVHLRLIQPKSLFDFANP